MNEATCETIAQIVRSMLLAPDDPPPPPRGPPASLLTASAPRPTLARRRSDLRAGYEATTTGGNPNWLTGPVIAASWLMASRPGSPIIVLSMSRAAGVFSSPGAPADASVAVWSIRAGAGWERCWQDRWWLSLEVTIGADEIQLAPVATGSTAGFLLAPTQRAARIAARPAVRGEVALARWALLFAQAQADLMPRARIDVNDGLTMPSYVIERRFGLGMAAGLGVRW